MITEYVGEGVGAKRLNETNIKIPVVCRKCEHGFVIDANDDFIEDPSGDFDDYYLECDKCLNEIVLRIKVQVRFYIDDES